MVFRQQGPQKACLAERGAKEIPCFAPYAFVYGCGATTPSLQLPYTPPTDAFALVLTVGMQLGEPGIAGGVEPVRRQVASAKILAAG